MSPYNTLIVVVAYKFPQLRGHGSGIQVLGVDFDLENLFDHLLDSCALLLFTNSFGQQHKSVRSNLLTETALSQRPTEQIAKSSKTVFLLKQPACLTKS